MGFVIPSPVLSAWTESGKTDISDGNMYSFALPEEPKGLQNWTLQRSRSWRRVFMSMAQRWYDLQFYSKDLTIDSWYIPLFYKQVNLESH